MRISISFVLGSALSVIAFGFICPATAAAQPKTTGASVSDDQTLERLLNEVRELRLTVERAVVDGTRVQLLIERARLQQGRVDTLTRQLDTIRSQVTGLNADDPQMQQQIKDAEEQLDRTPEPNAHAQLEGNIKAAKASLARMDREQEDLRNRETTLGSDLQTEQLKLNDLNNQLDALIKELKHP